MLPNNKWCDPSQPGPIISPRDATQQNPLVALDNGPVAVADASAGLMHSVWRAWVDNDNVYLSKKDGSAEQFLFSEPGIEKIDVTFNQNARAFIAFQAGSAVKIWWFDPMAGAEVISTIATGTQPFCYLDDRRAALSDRSDIILIYERENTVYWRQQRDRFLDEYTTTLVDLRSCKIEAFGMGKNNCLTIRAIEPRL